MEAITDKEFKKGVERILFGGMDYANPGNLMHLSSIFMERLADVDDPAARQSMIGKYHEIRSVLFAVCDHKRGCRGDDQFSVRTAVTLLATLLLTGQSSKNLAICLLPDKHVKEYYYVCGKMGRDENVAADFTREISARWLDEAWLDLYCKDAAPVYRPENMWRMLRISRKLGWENVPKELFSLDITHKKIREITDALVPRKQAEPEQVFDTEPKSYPDWACPALHDAMERRGITDADMPCIIRVKYVGNDFKSHKERIAADSVRDAHEKWASFCESEYMETESIESVKKVQ